MHPKKDQNYLQRRNFPSKLHSKKTHYFFSISVPKKVWASLSFFLPTEKKGKLCSNLYSVPILIHRTSEYRFISFVHSFFQKPFQSYLLKSRPKLSIKPAAKPIFLSEELSTVILTRMIIWAHCSLVRIHTGFGQIQDTSTDLNILSRLETSRQKTESTFGDHAQVELLGVKFSNLISKTGGPYIVCGHMNFQEIQEMGRIKLISFDCKLYVLIFLLL